MNTPHIKNAFSNIENACNQKLVELYPHGIPNLVQERYDKELSFLKDSELLDDFEIYRLLSKEALKCGQFFSFSGTISGSYLVYLMGSGRFNPLPTHYYCPKCGHFDRVETRLYGIDLPENPCPDCGTTMHGDGFNLPIESVWGLDGKKTMSFDYNISKDFRPFALKVLHNIYPNNVIVPYGILQSLAVDRIFNPTSVEMAHGGFIILPEGQSIEDYPDIKSYLEDGEPCLSGLGHIMENRFLKKIILLPSPNTDYLISLQRKTGIYAYEIGVSDLRLLTHYDMINSRTLNLDEEIFFSSRQPKTYFEMVGYHSLSHNSYANIDYERNDRAYEISRLLLDTSEFEKYPCYAREDFFEHLIKSGCSVEKAFEIAELIRKGRANKHPDFDNFDMPEELNKLAKLFTYIFPKAHSIEHTLLNARLAFYMKQDSKAYSKIVFSKK